MRVFSLLLLGFGVLLLAAKPAPAATMGLTATCSFTTATRLQCNIPILAGHENATIQYTSVQCNSTGTTAYNLQEFQILATPPNGAAQVPFQVAGNRASVTGVVNSGSNVNIHVKFNTASTAFIDLSPAPSGTTSCTVSLSAAF